MSGSFQAISWHIHMNVSILSMIIENQLGKEDFFKELKNGYPVENEIARTKISWLSKTEKNTKFIVKK